MTIKKLIEILETYPKNTEIFYNTNGYGDFEKLDNDAVYYDKENKIIFIG